MRKVDVSIIEALAKALDGTVQEYMQTIGTDQENFNLFRMNFIKKFSDDVMFLNELSGESDFYHRYGYLILRNMLEQFIEFLYVECTPKIDLCVSLMNIPHAVTPLYSKENLLFFIFRILRQN